MRSLGQHDADRHGDRRRQADELQRSAGPDPSEGHDPGTVCLAVAVGDPGDGGVLQSMQVRLPGRRAQVREFTVITLLGLLRRILLELG